MFSGYSQTAPFFVQSNRAHAHVSLMSSFLQILLYTTNMIHIVLYRKGIVSVKLIQRAFLWNLMLIAKILCLLRNSVKLKDRNLL